MSEDELNDLFNEFFANGPDSIPEPTPEQERGEAMAASELHILAFYEASETRSKGWTDMLSSWLEELQHYLPILERFEEYEQCAKVFKCIREIREVSANLQLNKELQELKVETVYESDDIPSNDEPDF